MNDGSTVARYLAAIVGHDWVTLADCVSEDVVRVGPFGDTYCGRKDYVAFLSHLMPTLTGYSMAVERIAYTADRSLATAELSETVEQDGTPLVTAESLVFDLDGDGRIRRVAIYIRTPQPASRPG